MSNLMGTRAWIGYQNADNTITATYAHWDGDPDGVGLLLKDYYNNPAKAKEVANLGYISTLREDIARTKEEARNQEEPMTFKSQFSFINDMQKDITIEWGYCYTKINQWMIYEGSSSKGILLNGIQNSSGIPGTKELSSWEDIVYGEDNFLHQQEISLKALPTSLRKNRKVITYEGNPYVDLQTKVERVDSFKVYCDVVFVMKSDPGDPSVGDNGFSWLGLKSLNFYDVSGPCFTSLSQHFLNDDERESFYGADYGNSIRDREADQTAEKKRYPRVGTAMLEIFNLGKKLYEEAYDHRR